MNPIYSRPGQRRLRLLRVSLVSLIVALLFAEIAYAQAPSISTQPANQSVTSGQSFTLTVAAAASGPLTYQWRRSGVALAGATLATFSRSSATRADSDHYDVVVRSGVDSITSQTATVRVSATTFPGLVGVDASFNAVIEADDGWVKKILRAPDGRIYVAGEFLRVDGVRTSGVARFKADLTVDTEFVAPRFEGEVADIALQPDGKVVAVGGFWRVAGQEGSYVARLNADGSHDPSFVFNAVSAASFGYSAVAIQSDGRILLAGSSRVIRVDPDGTRELKFDAPVSDVRTVVPLPDGKILVAGWAYSVNGVSSSQVKRLLADGSLDPSFGVDDGANGPIAAMVRLADGKILIGGSFTAFAGVSVSPILRLHADGTVDPTFGAGASRYAGTSVESIAVAGDGKIWVGGWNNALDGQGFARLTSDGSLEALLSAPSRRRSGQNEMGGGVSAIALLPDGSALAGGYFSHLGQAPRASLARVDAAGAVASPVINALSRRGFAFTLLPDASGRVLVGGYFDSINGVPTGPLARLQMDGSVDASFAFDAGFGFIVNEVMALADGGFLVRGDGIVSGSYRSKLARIGADGARDLSFAPSLAAEFYLTALAVAPGGKVVFAGRASGGGGAFSGRVFRVNADGSNDSSFATGNSAVLDGGVSGVTVQPDGKVVVLGSFSTFGGVLRPNIVRLNSDGTVDGTFASGAGFAGGSPEYFRASLTGIMVSSGGFTSYAGTATPGLVAIAPDGRRDAFFQAPAEWNRSSLTLQDDGQVFVWREGKFYYDPFGTNSTAPRVVRLKRTGAPDDGAVDPSFHLAGLRATDTILALAPGEDGSLFYSLRNTGAVHRTAAAFSPAFDAHPLPRVATVGGTTTFSVTAQAVPAPSFQWRKNSVAIAGATAATLTLSALTTADAGRYDVVATNSLGHATSSTTTLTVNPNAAPLIALVTPTAGSLVRVGLTPPDSIAVSATASDPDGTVTQVEFFADGVAFATDTTAPFSVNFVATSPGTYALTAVATDDSGNRTTSATVSLRAVAGSDPFATLSTSATDSTSVVNVPVFLTATATVAPGRTIASVQFFANGFAIGSPDTTFPYDATWVPYSAGVHALTAVVTDDLAVTGTSAPVTLTITTGSPPIVTLTSPPAGASVGVNSPVLLTATASASAPAVIASLTFYVNGVSVGTDVAFPYRVTWTPMLTGTYVLTVTATDTLANTATSSAVFVTVTPPPPTISTQPVSTTVVVGMTAVLTVVATDPAPISYQWRKGGVNLPGATAATLTLTNVQLAAAGSYEVAVSNLQATRVSDAAVLRVMTPAECHSADYTRDARIDLAELTRVLELYNTRTGSVRTGRYLVSAATVDGYAPDSSVTAGPIPTTPHSADLNRDGRLSLDELTRVIELYNARPAGTRTGAYHSDAATVDSFAPGQ